MPSCIASSFSHGLAFISSKPGAHDHLHVVAAEALRGAAAVHRGVAAAEHDHALADLRDVAEGHAREPVDADVDVGRRLLAAREGRGRARAARRSRRRPRRSPRRGSCFRRVDVRAALEVDAEVEDVADLLVDHLLGEAELRDLAADHAAGARVAVEHDDVVAERGEVARDGERGRARADAARRACRSSAPPASAGASRMSSL